MDPYTGIRTQYLLFAGSGSHPHLFVDSMVREASGASPQMVCSGVQLSVAAGGSPALEHEEGSTVAPSLRRQLTDSERVPEFAFTEHVTVRV